MAMSEGGAAFGRLIAIPPMLFGGTTWDVPDFCLRFVVYTTARLNQARGFSDNGEHTRTKKPNARANHADEHGTGRI